MKEGGTETTLAIDFGSTNSVAYLYKNGQNIRVNDDVNSGVVLFPSLVKYIGNQVFTCASALTTRNNKQNGHVVSCVKRLIGLTYGESYELCQSNIFGCSVVDGGDGYPRFVVSDSGKKKDCIEVASEIFKNIKKEAERMNDRKAIKNCYVTVPANYTEAQRSAIMSAAEKAGMTVNRFFIEPTAAAMSWCYDNAGKVDRGDHILVFDIGGGTLDLSILRYQGNDRFKVIKTDGNPRLGGNDVDLELAKSVCNDLHCDFDSFPAERQLRVLKQCEAAKIDLGSRDSVEMYMEEVGSKLNMDVTLHRKVLDNIVNTIFIPRIKACLDRILEGLNCDINFVLMVGGSSRLRAVIEYLKKRFSNALLPQIDPESCVAEGALLMATGDVEPIECLNFSYGILSARTNDVVMLLSKGTELPCVSESKQFQPTNNDPYIYSSVYQWNGSYEEGTKCHKPKSECTLVGDYRFSNRFRFGKKPILTLTFSAQEGGLLLVECHDQNGKVLNKTKYRNVSQNFRVC